MPAARRGHAGDIVSFDDLADARVVRSSAAAKAPTSEQPLARAEHGAESLDVVHRHPVPEFTKVSWHFVDDYIASTLAQRGWWRQLPAAQQQAIAATFWRVGRLTLEPWLAPRLDPDVVTPHPNTEVTEVSADGPEDQNLTLSDATVLAASHVIFADRIPEQIWPGFPTSPALSTSCRRRRVPGPERGLRDIVERACRHRFRVHPRLRPLLRVHRRLVFRKPHHRHRDDDLNLESPDAHPEPGKQVSARTSGRSGAARWVPATLHEPITSQLVAGTTQHEPPPWR